MSAKTPFPTFGPTGEYGENWLNQLKPVGVSKSLHYLLASGKPPSKTEMKMNYTQGLQKATAKTLDYPESYSTSAASKKHTNAFMEEYNREGLSPQEREDLMFKTEVAGMLFVAISSEGKHYIAAAIAPILGMRLTRIWYLRYSRTLLPCPIPF